MKKGEKDEPYHIEQHDVAISYGKVLMAGVVCICFVMALVLTMIIMGSIEKSPVYHMSEDKKYVYCKETGEVYRVYKDPFTTIQDIFGDYKQ